MPGWESNSRSGLSAALVAGHNHIGVLRLLKTATAMIARLSGAQPVGRTTEPELKGPRIRSAPPSICRTARVGESPRNFPYARRRPSGDQDGDDAAGMIVAFPPPR